MQPPQAPPAPEKPNSAPKADFAEDSPADFTAAPNSAAPKASARPAPDQPEELRTEELSTGELRAELSALASLTLKLTREMESHHMSARHQPMLGSFRNLWARFYPRLEVLETASGRWLNGEALDAFLNRACRHPRPVRVYLAEDGLGDSLYLSAALDNVFAKDPEAAGPDGKLIVSTQWADFFLGSPQVSHVIANRNLLNTQEFESFLRFLNFSTHYLYHWDLGLVGGAPCACLFTGGHFVEAMCREAGLAGQVSLEPQLFNFAPLRGKRLPARYLVMQSAGKERWKDWGAANFQSLANILAPEHKIIQVGLRGDPPLAGAIDLREKLTLPELAFVLRGADLFIGNSGGLLALARAAQTPAVAAFSQGDDPKTNSYADYANVEGDVRCDLCRTRQVMTISKEPCPRSYVCLSSISLEAMAEAVRAALKRGRSQGMFQQTGLVGPGSAVGPGSLAAPGRQFILNSWKEAAWQVGQARQVELARQPGQNATPPGSAAGASGHPTIPPIFTDDKDDTNA